MQPHERVIAFDLVGLAAGDIERLITVDKARVWREAIVASPVSRFRRQLGEDQKGMDFWAIGASLSPCRDKGRLAHPGSCPAGDGATAGPRW